MTDVRLPRSLKFDSRGKIALIAAALLFAPSQLIWIASAIFLACFMHWFLPALKPLSQAERKFFIASIFGEKLQKILIGTAALLLIRVFMESFHIGWYGVPFYNDPKLGEIVGLTPQQHLLTLTAWKVPQVAVKDAFFYVVNSYLFAGLVSVWLKLGINIATKKANDTKRANAIGSQLWNDISFAMFNLAYYYSLYTVAFGETGRAISNWLVAAARDSNLLNMDYFIHYIIEIYNNVVIVNPPQTIVFDFGIKATFFLALYLASNSAATRLSALMVATVKRMLRRSVNEFTVAPFASFIEALRMKRSTMKLNESNVWLRHTSASFWWIASSYLTLFYLFGVAGGPLGETVCGWFDHCLKVSGLGAAPMLPQSPMHHFLGAVVALYGTIPLAISGSVFLPFSKRKQLIINEDGMFLPGGGIASSKFRVWDDFKAVMLLPSKETDIHKRAVKFEFYTGGSLTLKVSQLSAANLHNLLSSIDESACNVRLSDDVLALKDILAEEDSSTADSSDLRKRNADNYMSTVFVPLEPDQYVSGRRARIVRLLASKPLAAVYLARDRNGSLIIVKQFYLADETAETRALKKIFERECAILKQLNHPSISKVIDHFQDGNSSFLLLEHAKGHDLRSHILFEGKKPESVVMRWAERLALIMKYLHEQAPCVLHRDLTPDNIVISDEGNLRLIDFGAAHQFLEGITGTMIGKQCYTAPEQLRGNASPRSDIYSFGCTLYFLLTGEDPVALSQCSPINKVKVSPALDRFIRACTEFDEADRIQNFDQVLEELKQCALNPYWQGDQTRHLEEPSWSGAPQMVAEGKSELKSELAEAKNAGSSAATAFSSLVADVSERLDLNLEDGAVAVKIAREVEKTS